jgi:hypothetical protein
LHSQINIKHTLLKNISNKVQADPFPRDIYYKIPRLDACPAICPLPKNAHRAFSLRSVRFEPSWAHIKKSESESESE